MQIRIGYLYPELLNIYGDRGNIICLKNRCSWRGIETKIDSVSLNDRLEQGQFDLFFGGGGQDRQQLVVSQDLQKKEGTLRKEAKRGIPMLTICGTYQLFGHYFKTHEGERIPGISIFDIITIASHQRKIGNIIIKLNQQLRNTIASNGIPIGNNKIGASKRINSLVGFENHSGNSFLTPRGCKSDYTEGKEKTVPLGTVIKGFGNNGKDKTEGAIYKNVFGCYLHGPLLPKNPHFADLLIKKALEVRYEKKIKLKTLSDHEEWEAHRQAIKRTYHSRFFLLE